MGHHIIEFDEQCKSCGGTGIYIGMAERDGSGVVCSTCKGTGCHHVKIEYDDFIGKIKTSEVKQVYETNPGIMIGTGNGKYDLSDFGGMPYEQWLQTGIFPKKSENRGFSCPRWWYQIADYKKAPKWDECKKALGCGFSRCPSFSEKEKCWRRFDKDNSGQ